MVFALVLEAGILSNPSPVIFLQAFIRVRQTGKRGERVGRTYGVEHGYPPWPHADEIHSKSATRDGGTGYEKREDGRPYDGSV
jgi:hypothetical protein